MRKYGLVGKNISYSFSENYFTKKFKKEQITDANYQTFDISEVNQFKKLLKDKSIKGFNVTIPYKETIVPLLDKLNSKSAQIGAVNTIKVTKNGLLKGYNTDYYGFQKSLEPLLEKHHKKALILGTGGASKAVAFALERLNISYRFVSRTQTDSILSYHQIDKNILTHYYIIINCTPLGTFPKVSESPNIPYKKLNSKHLLYDLIYNPEETEFLKKGKTQGSKIKNGLEMLELQAEKAWIIWNK